MRAIILSFTSDDSVVVVGHDLQMHTFSRDQLEPLPLSVCFMCGSDEPNTPEEDEKAFEHAKRDWGAVPPEERRMAVCAACAPRLYRMDREAHEETGRCTCAASRGESLRCTCEWRRARGYRP